jgi:hypothetical protein
MRYVFVILIAFLVVLRLERNATRADFTEQRPRAWVAPDPLGKITRQIAELSDRLAEEKRAQEERDRQLDAAPDYYYDELGTIYRCQIADTYFTLAQQGWVLYWRDRAYLAAESDPSLASNILALSVFFSGNGGVINGGFMKLHVDRVVESIRPLLYDAQLEHDLLVWRNEAKAALGSL